MLSRFLVLFTIFVCSAAGLTAQQVQQFRNYSAESGLSQSVVLSIAQDNRGYLWVATEVGLNRFDGTQFTAFYQEHGLPSNRVNVVYSDNTESLWAGTDMGIVRWNGNHFETPAIADTLSGIPITSIFQDSKNRLWIGTEGFGVWLIDGSSIKAYKSTNGLSGDRVREVIETANGLIWIGTREGLTVINPNGSMKIWTESHGLPDNRVRSLTIDPLGRLWVGTRSGIAIFRNQIITDRITTDDGLVNNMVKKVVFDHFNQAWVTTEEGFSIIDGDEYINLGLEDGFGSSIFNTVYHDREGNIWIGTFGAGVFRYLGERFETMTVRDGLADNMVTAIRKTANDLWISTYGGGVTQLTNGINRLWNSSNGLVDERVFDLHVDSSGALWIATRNGINIIRDGKISSLTVENGLPFRIIRTITADPDGSLWFGTDGGGLIHLRNGMFENITTTEGLIHNTIRSVKFASDGSMWIGSYGGLNHFHNGVHKHFTSSDGLANNIVLDVLTDSDGSVWAATFGGLSHLKDGIFSNYTVANGLPSDVIYLIHKDIYDNYWIGTTRGLVRFRTDNLDGNGIPIFKRYTTDYGLSADELNRGAVFGRGDTLWFGTVGGLSIYYRDRDPETNFRPPIYLEQVRVFDQVVTDLDDVSLGFRDNSLWFDYTALSYSAPEKLTYEYRLHPIDSEWLPTDQKSVRYAGLPSGDYIFEVRARSNDGQWSEQPAVLDFTIRPPFYSTWWFRLILIVSFIGLIAFLYNYYRVNKQVDLERMRVRIASDLHDDVGASLTEIALQTDFLQAYPIPDSLKYPLQQIGETSRRIVTTMDDIVWSIDARNDTVGDLTDRMQDYARNLLSNSGISYDFIFEHLDTNHSLPVEVRQNVYLIFKEMINNAAKHSKATHIDVRLSRHNNSSSMFIKDNGVGLANQTRKTGHGLKNLRLRAERINANIEFIDRDGFGIELTGKNIF